MHTPEAPYLFIIDTDTYAGNFERELCAYITGNVGECGVGKDMAALFAAETGREPFENVQNEPDENGCWRPATIFPTPGWFNNGQGAEFEDKPENEGPALEAYKTAARAGLNSLYHGYLKSWREGNREQYEKSGWTEEKLVAACAAEECRVAKAEALTALPFKYPADLSVAISFQARPTPEQIDLMKSRAHAFAKLKSRYGDVLRIGRILGFRLVKQKIERHLDSETI